MFWLAVIGLGPVGSRGPDGLGRLMSRVSSVGLVWCGVVWCGVV